MLPACMWCNAKKRHLPAIVFLAKTVAARAEWRTRPEWNVTRRAKRIVNVGSLTPLIRRTLVAELRRHNAAVDMHNREAADRERFLEAWS